MYVAFVVQLWVYTSPQLTVSSVKDLQLLHRTKNVLRTQEIKE